MGEDFHHHPNESRQIFETEPIRLRQRAVEVSTEGLADLVIEQGVFVGEMRVEGRAIDPGPFTDVLHGDRGKAPLTHELAERARDELTGPPDPRIGARFGT